jgi:hypothetical protein
MKKLLRGKYPAAMFLKEVSLKNVSELYSLQGGPSSKMGATEAFAPPLMVPWDRSKKEESNQAKR